MDKILFFVGGTGQHILLSYLHLLRLAGMEPLKNLYVFDGDESNKPGSVTQSIVSSFGRDVVKFINPNPSYVHNELRFKDMLSPSQDALDLELMPAFYKQKELNMETLHGFYATPTVGAATIALALKELIENKHRLSETDINRHFADLHRNITANYPLRVGIVGSIFGGTAAGSVPILGKHFRDWREGYTASIFQTFCILHYKWFNLTEYKGSEPDPIKLLDEKKLKSNAHAGVRYYKDALNSTFNRIMLLGLPNPVIRENDGGIDQKENKDFLYILSGALLHFYSYASDDSFPEKETERILESFAIEKSGITFEEIKMLTGKLGDYSIEDWEKPEIKDNLMFHYKVSYNTIEYLDWLIDELAKNGVEPRPYIGDIFKSDFKNAYRGINADQQKVFCDSLNNLSVNLRGSLDWLNDYVNSPSNLSYTLLKFELPQNYIGIVPPEINERNKVCENDREKQMPQRFSRRKKKNWEDIRDDLSKILEDCSDKLQSDQQEAAKQAYKDVRNYFYDKL